MSDNVNQSASNDLQGGVRMGQDAAKTAKSAQKVAASLASGNVAGAAVSAAMDPRIRRAIIAVVLLVVLIPTILIVFFLYALPTTVYEVVVTFFDGFAEEWKAGTFGGSKGIVVSGITQAITMGWDMVTEAVSGVFNTIWSVLTGSTGDSADPLTMEGYELLVTQVEAQQKFTLERKIDATINKIDSRVESLESAIYAQQTVINNYFAGRYSHLYDEWGGTNISVISSRISKIDALNLLSAYTVVTAASVQDMRLSDYMKWLGYYNEFSSAKTTFDLGGVGIQGEVRTWQGTFMPQYLVEQRLYEIEQYGREVTDFSALGCAAVDLLLIVVCPDFSTVTSSYTERVETYEVEDPETGEVSEESRVITTGYVNLSIAIRTRSVDELTDHVIGLWSGSLNPATVDLDEGEAEAEAEAEAA